MIPDLDNQRYAAQRMATAPETGDRINQSAVFRHATDPIDATRLGYGWTENNSSGSERINGLPETSNSGRPNSGATSPSRRSFDSDLRNYFRQSRRFSLPYDAGNSVNRDHTGAPLFDSALSRYRGTLLPISPPPKEKERLRSLTKLFSGSWNKKPAVSEVTNPQHVQHVEFDPNTGHFVGLPSEWERILSLGESGHQWNALMNIPTSPARPPVSASLYGTQSSGRSAAYKRLTLSSTTESFYSYNSRYHVPAERPPSFPSTTASMNEEVSSEPNVLRHLPTTPRPLPYTPL